MDQQLIHRTQHGIPSRMPVRVIDGLEPVDIGQYYGQLGVVALGVGELALETVLEEMTVEQTG